MISRWRDATERRTLTGRMAGNGNGSANGRDDSSERQDRKKPVAEEQANASEKKPVAAETVYAVDPENDANGLNASNGQITEERPMRGYQFHPPRQRLRDKVRKIWRILKE